MIDPFSGPGQLLDPVGHQGTFDRTGAHRAAWDHMQESGRRYAEPCISGRIDAGTKTPESLESLESPFSAKNKRKNIPSLPSIRGRQALRTPLSLALDVQLAKDVDVSRDARRQQPAKALSIRHASDARGHTHGRAGDLVGIAES